MDQDSVHDLESLLEAMLDARCVQAAEEIRHCALNAAIDAQIVAEVEQQLKAQQVFAVALVQRSP